MASQTSRVRRIEHFRNMETMTAYTQRKSERKREKGIDRLNRRSIRLLMISYTKRNVCARTLRPHTGRHSFWLFFCYCCSLYSIEIESLFHFFCVVVVVVCCVRYSAFVSASSLPVLCWNKNKKNAVAACNQCVMCLNAITHVIFLMTWPTFNAARCCWWIIME